MTDKSHAFGKFLFVLGWGGAVAAGMVHGQGADVMSGVFDSLRARVVHAAQEAILEPLEARAAPVSRQSSEHAR